MVESLKGNSSIIFHLQQNFIEIREALLYGSAETALLQGQFCSAPWRPAFENGSAHFFLSFLDYNYTIFSFIENGLFHIIYADYGFPFLYAF